MVDSQELVLFQGKHGAKEVGILLLLLLWLKYLDTNNLLNYIQFTNLHVDRETFSNDKIVKIKYPSFNNIHRSVGR